MKYYFYFRVISWVSWPTIPHEVNYVSFSIKLATFQASGRVETRHPTPETYINYRCACCPSEATISERSLGECLEPN